jgi:serine/threonine protein kinase
MAEGEPPYFHVHPMRVLFMIPTNPPPTLSKPGQWSPDLNDFIANCLIKDQALRPSAKQLIKVNTRGCLGSKLLRLKLLDAWFFFF